MRRREFLAGSAGLISPVAGCLDPFVPGGSSGTQNPANQISTWVETESRWGETESSVADKEQEPRSLTISVSESTLADVLVDVEFELTNTRDTPFSIYMGPPEPFGILVAYGENVQNDILLWNEKYEESSAIHLDGRSIVGIEVENEGQEIQPGETISDTYWLSRKPGVHDDGGNELRPGTYEFREYPGSRLYFGGTFFRAFMKMEAEFPS